ncbi:sphingomyelin phosphodiesterase-like [Tribolium madens]|uniref:sphingomyelin phosphodiesterase-like n=1 Tax=Tribolium madens TaxID=41895 RepID=UPI001CF74A79|nr:sphingomyelin phosphodiesterase-like [Tribolium madens]
MHISVFLILAFNIFLVSCHNHHNEIPQIISHGVQTLQTTRTVPQRLSSAVKNITKIPDRKLANDIFCQSCELVFNQIIEYRRGGANRDSMITYFQKLCRLFTDWGGVACDGYINIEIDTVLFIIDNKKDLTGFRVCAIAFQQKTCKDPNMKKWTVAIPPPRRHAHHQHNHHKAAPLKLLHLTDFHYDPLYQAGSNAACDLPLCCQQSNGPPSKPSNAAGFWGDYHVCDIPWYTITNFTSYLTQNHANFDLVYYTGDIISHRSWATTKDHNVESIQKIFKLFKDTFNTTPVYPILGNHEPHPTDFYSPGDVSPKISTQWVFDLMAIEWARWLPNDTSATIKTGGYYTVLVKPKFRIVALNSNVCFTSNLWLLYDDDDPYGQLKWLVEVLSEAEKKGEKVHILSHIPPGEVLCLQRWSNQFHKIVNRFAPIIVAQFNGHTHLDELRLFRDANNTKKIINVAYNAGSFTTFVRFNPNYRTYNIDTNDYRVLDYDQYTFNLTKANQDKNKSPEWFKLYSFKDAYGLKNTSYDSLADMLNRMSKNHTLMQQYFRFQGRESAPAMASGCSDNCQAKLRCAITAVEADEAIQCQQIKKKTKKSKH